MNPYLCIITFLCCTLMAINAHSGSKGIVRNWIIGDHGDVAAHCFVIFITAFIMAIIVIREWTGESNGS